ncbi:ATP synthase F1 subunit delta [bacterium]|nr:MAG: ATP synthase F1 subunit delta [bacterium]
MATIDSIAKRYADAVFALARERGVSQRVGDDLAAVAGVLEADEYAREFFASPVIQREDKSKAVAAAFDGRVHEVTLHLLLLLVRKRRESLIAAIAARYAAALREERGETPLTVVSAHALTQQAIDALKARLDGIFGKNFQVSQRVDAALIGGLQLQFGDRRYDGSIDGRLTALASQLL